VIRIVRPDSIPAAWDALAAAVPGISLFQRPRWMRALLYAYPPYRPAIFVAEDGEDVPGVLPAVAFRRFGFRQLVSLPFGTHGGPLLRPGREADAGAALIRAFRAAAGAPDVLRFEMTCRDPGPALRAELEGALGKTIQASRTHEIDLAALRDNPWSGSYARGARRSVEAAERAGVRVTRGREPERLAGLARLHAAQSRGWTGIPPHPPQAIARMAAFFGEDAAVFTAEREGTSLAACLVLRDGGDAVPWVSGSLPEARDVKAFHLVVHAALADAAEGGCARWHFGGSGGNPQIEFFKESFGAAAVPVVRCHRLAGWARRLRARPAWDA
jgi:hypothetical protein